MDGIDPAPDMLTAHGHLYHVVVDPNYLVARVVGADGRRWFDLRLLHAVNTRGGIDETTGVQLTSRRTEQGEVIVRTQAQSSLWNLRWTELRCGADGMSLTGGVRGAGSVLSVHALGGYAPPEGFLPSGSALGSVVSPNPDHPRRLVRPAGEPAVISVVGSGGQPGVGRWLFTPAPWCFAVSRDRAVDEHTWALGDWAWIGLLAPVAEHNFTSMHYEAGSTHFALRWDYEGHTLVDGEFSVPRVDIRFGAADPVRAIADYSVRARELAGRSAVIPFRHLVDHPNRAAAQSPSPPHWWREPLFCGWGAQRALAERSGSTAPAECTQVNYDGFLATLADHGLVPGTVVVDDKWAQEYATCEPDPKKWPDLRGWIADRHAAGQRVLLWWKAWDAEGAAAAACVRMPDGTAVSIDPESASGRALVTSAVSGMLAADGLDADGLKIDFTATTPSGTILRHSGSAWGGALLHRLLDTVYRSAKAAKPDALVVTHTPNPSFADITDMVRLNDVVWLDAPDPAVDVPAQMVFRAAMVRAALPDKLIDTDGWYLPPGQFREYVAAQPELGVPALYYAGQFDQPGQDMDDADFAAVRVAWARYRDRF